MKRPLLLVLLLAGCSTVGPDYHEPEVPVPVSYSAPAIPGSSELDHWWRSFGDHRLAELVELALKQNLDIKVAAARIREARALEQATAAGSAPQLAVEGSVNRQRISENAIPVPPGSGGSNGGGLGLPGEEFTTWRAGFDARWEIDLFGRNRREREAASARTGASVWDRRDAEVSVAAEVARAYLDLRALQERIVNAKAELSRQQRLEDLVAARRRGGLVTGEELDRRRADRAAAAALVPELEARSNGEIHALGLLTGQSPGALRASLSTPAALPPAPSIPPGLPSELLRRRPDIRSAERELAAATADIGVAVADLYPRISLTAAPALVSTALGSLLEWGSRGFAAGAALDWPIFDGGRRRATVEARNARQEQAMAQYRKSVLVAMKDVEDALVRIEGDRGQLGELEQAVSSAARAEEIALARHRGGLASLTDPLEARQRRLSLEGRLIDTRAALARDTVGLVKALGGGWQEEGQ